PRPSCRADPPAEPPRPGAPGTPSPRARPPRATRDRTPRARSGRPARRPRARSPTRGPRPSAWIRCRPAWGTLHPGPNAGVRQGDGRAARPSRDADRSGHLRIAREALHVGVRVDVDLDVVDDRQISRERRFGLLARPPGALEIF